MSDDIATTKAELEDVLELLKDSPDDEELLQLKSDLMELIELAEGENDDEDGDTDDNVESDPPAETVSISISSVLPSIDPPLNIPTYEAAAEAFSVSPATLNGAPAPAPEKKKKPTITSSTEFKIPENLKLQSTDTEEEKLKKRKKVKRLKNKFKEAKGEVVSNEKAASWKNFVKGGKKKTKRKGVGKDSQFSTKDEEGVAVGGKGSTGDKRQKFTY